MKKIVCIISIAVAICATALAQTRTDSIHVAHYDLNLSLNINAGTIAGFADLAVVAKISNLPYIDLDLLSFTVDSVFVNAASIANFSRTIQRLRVPLPTPANANDTIKLRIYYHGTPAMNTGGFGGFYFMNDHAFNIGVTMDVYPPNYGRVWYPCLDFFTDKSTYTFNITTESNKMAVCGGALVATETLANNAKRWIWQLDEPVPTYLTSIAVGNFQLYADTFSSISGRHVPISIYAPPGYESRIEGSFVNLKKVLNIYETCYGAYRWNRVGYVLIGFSSGGMEHVTNIALPISAINGMLTYESLIMHELAHSWFGNLVTCNRAEEMWINEGFTTFCESVYRDNNFWDTPRAHDYAAEIQKTHANTLKTIKQTDGGYYALDALPHAYTYGTHAYDRGALVVHTLRNYVGDSLFFHCVQSMLNDYAFQNISSQELFDYFSEKSGVPLQDFFEAWVHQPGYLHFSIDSIRQNGGAGQYRVFVRQRRHHAPNFGNSNKLELTFFSADNQQVTKKFQFSGEFGIMDVNLPFEPQFGIIDWHNKMSAAVIKESVDVTNNGFYNTQYSDFTAQISNFAATDAPAIIVVEHNFVAPDSLKLENRHIYRLSNNHYWRVEIAGNAELQGKLGFYYNFSTSEKIDSELFDGYGLNDLILLYRRDATDDWRIIHSRLQSNGKADWIFSQTIAPGEYCLAIGNPQAATISDETGSTDLQLFPNPTDKTITVITPHWQAYSKVELYDLQGKKLRTFRLHSSTSQLTLPELTAGIYIFNFYDKKAHLTDTRKVTIQKYQQ